MSRYGYVKKDPWSGFDYIPISLNRGNLYLGGWETGQEELIMVEELKMRRVDLVIGLGFKTHPLETARCANIGLRAKIIVADIDDYISAVDEMREFITKHLETLHIALISGDNVYVHCHAGMSRSVTFVLAYLMEYHDYTLEEAYDHVREHRPCICPNPGFHRLLVERASFKRQT